ncbi:hypothetical protein LTR09_002812 [Extremus antarcticus]|uniref:Uncharacterized protein n=1 Tax=Extremus antarcticus TaxID=702011 RepID=A0AAJ0GF38_9PEZI|nr:hypothetical protein LTR09_002812 [Extremus antarcticus]
MEQASASTPFYAVLEHKDTVITLGRSHFLPCDAANKHNDIDMPTATFSSTFKEQSDADMATDTPHLVPHDAVSDSSAPYDALKKHNDIDLAPAAASYAINGQSDTSMPPKQTSPAVEEQGNNGIPASTCHLLALAGELRNNIYGHVAPSEELYLQDNGSLTLASPLACTNRQIRSEYLPIIKAEYTAIATVVHLSSYGPVTLVDHTQSVADKRQLSSLPAIRCAHIGLHAESPYPTVTRTMELAAWVSRGDADLEATYYFTDDADPDIVVRIVRDLVGIYGFRTTIGGVGQDALERDRRYMREVLRSSGALCGEQWRPDSERG